MNPCNAMIKNFGLGVSDRYGESLELWMELELQGGGNVCFTVWGPFRETYDANVFAHSVKRVLDIVGVRNLSDINGKPVRAKFKGNGNLGDEIVGIGHFLKDDWFIPREEPLYQRFFKND